MSSEDGHSLSIHPDADETVLRSIEPEVGDIGSEASMEDGGIVTRHRDLPTLRASLNGWTRLLSVAEETERIERS